MTYVPIPIVPPTPPSPRTRELAELLARVIEEYEKLRSRFYGRGAYDFGEGSLNRLGYALLEKEDAGAAIAVFRENARQFPESSNVYDSLAEAFLASGRADSAKYYYERAVELDPRNRNAKQKLKELEGK